MPKFRLRHYIYMVVGVVAFFKCLSPVCILKLNVRGVLSFFLVFAVITLTLEIYFLFRRSYQIKAYLDRGDIDGFLTETEKESNHFFGGQWKQFYQINKTAGLYYQGHFEEAITLLDTINYLKLPKVYRYLYINNRLANLLGAERVDEAEKLIDENQDAFQPSTHNRQIYAALQSNLGLFKYFKGELQTAHHLISESMKMHQFQLALAMGHYYLGRIAEKEGEVEVAEDHFQKAKALGPNTYIMDRLK